MVSYRVVGLDISLTNTGWCVAYGQNTTGSISTDPKKKVFSTRGERIRHIINRLKPVFGSITYNTNIETFTLIEGYAFSKKSTSVVQLGELGGVVRELVYVWTGIEPIEIPNTSLKKYITGRGDGKKEDLKLAAYKKYGVDFQNAPNDECDAYCLAMLGLDMLGLDSSGNISERTQYQKDAIKKIEAHSAYAIHEARKRICL